MDESTAILFSGIFLCILVAIVAGAVIGWIWFLRKKMIIWGLRVNQKMNTYGDVNNEEKCN